MRALMNTKDLYLIDACCYDCLRAGRILPGHDEPDRIERPSHVPGVALVRVVAPACSDADDFIGRHARGEVIDHRYVPSDYQYRPPVVDGKWTATVRGQDHLERMYGPGYTFDERFGVVRADDPRLPAGDLGDLVGAS